MRPSTDLLDFLNKAQQVTSAFFPPDSKTARLEYTLRPLISNDTQNLNFKIDGQSFIWNAGDVIQRDAYWPGSSAASKSSLSSGDKANQIPFAGADGPWAAFRLFQQGERSSRTLTWKMTSSGAAMDPVQVEFVYEFPGGIDVFDRSFFKSLRCPNVAAQR
jgi:type VI protein secretion system component VasK